MPQQIPAINSSINSRNFLKQSQTQISNPGQDDNQQKSEPTCQHSTPISYPTPINPSRKAQLKPAQTPTMEHHRNARLIQTILATHLLALAAAKVPAVIVFGDSSVDAGNNNRIPTILKSNFRPYGRDFPGGRPTGRFSNGRIPSDFISDSLGVKPTVPAYLDPAYNISDFATGVCFASAGTGYDNATSDVLSVIPLWKQLENYKQYQSDLRSYTGRRKADSITRNALYLMSLGTNDFLENYYTLGNRRYQFSVAQYEDFLVGIARNFVVSLYRLGARKISLGGLPPMGCLPLERSRNLMNSRNCIQQYNIVAVQFNDRLKRLVLMLNRRLPGLNLVYSNVYDRLLQIIQKPSFFGFDVSTTACCATGTFEMGYTCDQLNPFTCSDASKYVFWDSFHPTEKTNDIVSDYLLKTSLATFS